MLFAVRVTINVEELECLWLLLTYAVLAGATGRVAVVSLLLACWPDLPVLPMGHFACRSRCRTYCTGVFAAHAVAPLHLTHTGHATSTAGFVAIWYAPPLPWSREAAPAPSKWLFRVLLFKYVALPQLEQKGGESRNLTTTDAAAAAGSC